MKWRIPVAEPDIDETELNAVIEVVKSGWITQGEQVRRFEQKFAESCGVKHGVATNTGTSALHTALIALGISSGDEVITTPLTCVATVIPIILQGATPVFVDIVPETFNMDVNLVKDRITERTKAIIVVHLFGHPVDMDPLMKIATEHGLWVIEDAAQALGAGYKGRKVGSIGHAACFSLYVNKIITTGEGGMVVTNDTELARKMKSIRNFGEDESVDFCHPIFGCNYKMMDIQAAIGLRQLTKLKGFIEKRRQNVAELNEQLKGVNGIDCLPSEANYAKNIYFSYYVQMVTKELRDKTKYFLEQRGIETRPFFSIVPAQPPYQKMGCNLKDIPRAVDVYNKGFYISNSPGLNSEAKKYIVDSFKKALSG